MFRKGAPDLLSMTQNDVFCQRSFHTCHVEGKHCAPRSPNIARCPVLLAVKKSKQRANAEISSTFSIWHTTKPSIIIQTQHSLWQFDSTSCTVLQLSLLQTKHGSPQHGFLESPHVSHASPQSALGLDDDKSHQVSSSSLFGCCTFASTCQPTTRALESCTTVHKPLFASGCDEGPRRRAVHSIVRHEWRSTRDTRVRPCPTRWFFGVL